MPSLSRRDFLKTSALAAAGLLLPEVPIALAARPRPRPNLIVFYADDQANLAVGYASNGLYKTPNLDRLARRGVTFSSAYCSAITCVPARTTFLSGLHYHRAEKADLGDTYVRPLKPGAWTWAHALRARGYRTALFGKGHFAPLHARHGFDIFESCESAYGVPLDPGDPPLTEYQRWLQSQGIPDYYGGFAIFPKDKKELEKDFREHGGAQAFPFDTRYHRLTWLRQRAIDFIHDCRDLNQPFALEVSFPYPHAPYVPSKEFLDLYDETTLPMPTERWHDMEGLPADLQDPDRWQPSGIFNAYSLSRAAYQRSMACYRALCSQMDAAVGAILKHVDLDNTLVIYTSDHGDYQARRGRLTKVPWVPFDAVAKVPLLIAGAGIPPGLTLQQPVQAVDLAPTLLQAVGAPIPEGLDGIPLQPYFEDPDCGKDRLIYCCGFMQDHMVRWHDQKYFSQDLKATGEMFVDLTSDPGEWKNLASDPSRQKEKDTRRAKFLDLMAQPPPKLPHF